MKRNTPILIAFFIFLFIQSQFLFGQNLQNTFPSIYDAQTVEHNYPFGNSPYFFDASKLETFYFQFGITTNTFKGQDGDIYFTDSVINYSTDQRCSKRIYTYDNDGNWTSLLMLYWDNGNFVQSNLLNYTYDDQGRKVQGIYQLLEDGAWKNFEQYIFSYYDDGNLRTLLLKRWINNAWENSKVYFSTYDEMGNQITESSQYWSNNEWVNSHFYSYTYTEN